MVSSLSCLLKDKCCTMHNILPTAYQLLFPDALRVVASCKCLLIAMVMASRHDDTSASSIAIP